MELLSVNQLSKITDIDRRTIDKRLAGLIAKPGPKRAKLYDSSEALKILYGVDKSKEPQTTLEEEQLRYERARADKMELEVAQRKGELVPIVDVASVVEQEYSAVRAAALSIPSKLAHQLSIVDKPEEIKRHLEDAVNEFLSEMSDAEHGDKFSRVIETDTQDDTTESSETEAETNPS